MNRTPKKPLRERLLDAEQHGSHWLALGNEYAERGDRANAERCYAKSQRWLDRANLLSGQGDRPAPKH